MSKEKRSSSRNTNRSWSSWASPGLTRRHIVSYSLSCLFGISHALNPYNDFMKRLLGIYFLSLCYLATALYAQELYRWVDEKGGVHFTDNFDSIPKKSRENVERRNLPNRRQPSTSSISPEAASPSQRFVVPFTREGNAIIVEALVNGRGPVKFILDTGASLTVIPLAQAKNIGIDPEKGDPLPVTGVGGTVVVSQVKINTLTLEGAQVRNLEVAIHPGFGEKGLLGMDFLSEFRIDINHSENEVILVPQSGPHEGRSLEWWQQRFRYWNYRKQTFEQILATATSPHVRKVADSRLRATEKKIRDLEIRASRAGVPRKLRQ